jgi:TPP-dependent pyruvate/acetoin dehydrogenase alpha subunit
VAGPCGGKGGRGHLADPAAGFFGAHAVVGGNLTIAVGVALAVARLHPGRIVACVFGDGACGAGALHEALNIAALWQLPLLFVCDNNGYSVSTPRAEALSPRRLSDLAQPFGIPAVTIDGMDVVAVRDAAREAADRARAGRGPSFVECLSERFQSHSTSTRETRTTETMTAVRERCPIRRYHDRLQAEGTLSAAAWTDLEREVDAEVAAALRFADASPFPDPDEVLRDVV